MAFPDYGAPSPTKPQQGKTPAGGLGQMLQRLLAGSRPQQGGAQAPVPGAPPQAPAAPAPMPPPGMPPMGGAPGGMPMPSPEEMQAIMEQVKGELMKRIAGQSGQQDRIFEVSRGLGSYKPNVPSTGPTNYGPYLP